MKFRSDPSKIRGSIAPLMTPFTADGAVDHASLTNLVNWQLAQGTHGISIGGSTGEPSAQTIPERIAAIKTVAEAVGDRVPLMPGTGTEKLDETLELTAAARDLGIDAALIITPYYARPTQEALYVWYKTVAQEFPDLPIVAYNVPSRTAVDIAPETVARLYRDFDNFVGVKETTKDFEHFSRVLQLCGRDLLVWSGIELLCLPLLALGGVGFLSATANIAPRAHADLYEAWESGHLERAR
jgi:4-hydroxy-tetrahydrodipicolinate synthase